MAGSGYDHEVPALSHEARLMDPTSWDDAAADLLAPLQGGGPIPELSPAELPTPPGGNARSASEQAYGPRSGHGTLRFGATGDGVIDLQARLAADGEDLAVDGIFGDATRRAVIRYQAARGLVADGVVGAKTWAALEAAAPPDRVLETLDRDGDTTPETEPGDGNLLGIPLGKPKAKPAPAVQPPRPHEAELLAGDYDDLGDYRPTGDGFANADLDALLGAYGAHWQIDVRAPATPPATQPPWVKAMGSAIAAVPSWGRAEQVTRKLLEVFVRADARARTGGDLPVGVAQLAHSLGGGNANGQALSLGATKDNKIWCAQASSSALILGMYRKGIRFAGGGASHVFAKEMRRQSGLFTQWSKQGHTTAGDTHDHAVPLAAGDIATIVGHGTPLTGHMVTVVEATDQRITYVSGNGAQFAVAAEEVVREPPPNGYDWNKVSARVNRHHDHTRDAATHDKNAKKARELMWGHEHAIRTALGNKIAVPMNPDDPLGVAIYAETAKAMASSAADPGSVTSHANQLEYLAVHVATERGQATANQVAAAAMLQDGSKLPVSKTDPRFTPGVHAPKDPGHAWVVSVIQASALMTAAVLADGPTPAALPTGLERCPPIDVQCPDIPKDAIK